MFCIFSFPMLLPFFPYFWRLLSSWITVHKNHCLPTGFLGYSSALRSNPNHVFWLCPHVFLSNHLELVGFGPKHFCRPLETLQDLSYNVYIPAIKKWEQRKPWFCLAVWDWPWDLPQQCFRWNCLKTGCPRIPTGLRSLSLPTSP